MNFIGALFVDVKFQGMGIGSKLIDYSIEKYKGICYRHICIFYNLIITFPVFSGYKVMGSHSTF
ncbi:GNAT family N-acetyltransferase, partial [Paraclostridium bifermentans]|uniref:GNAT family N-acetyltransferase n=1 Tax=Paraclostridium bifermentans TaxID=1490 RepID=UPI0021C330C8